MRVVPKISGFIYKETYNNSGQFIFLHDLLELQYTYSIVSAAAVFQSYRRVHLAPEESPTQTHSRHCHLKICVTVLRCLLWLNVATYTN